METAGKLLQRHVDGLPGVASARLALVLAIVAFQSVQVSEDYLRIIGTPMWILAAILYPALFAISGFLLARSIEHYRFRDFLALRLRRLLPLLVMTVLLAALAMGPLATTLSLPNYVTDPEFPLYFANILAWPRFTLPGVFQFNNFGAVINLPLWLSPFVVTMIAILGLVHRFGARALVVAIGVLVVAVVALALLVPNLAGLSGLARNLLDGSGAAVMLAFLLGALAYRLRFRLPIHPPVAYAMVAVLAGVALLGNRNWIDISAVHLLLVVPVSYIVLFMAFQLLPLPAQALRLERYLFGMLLFSFPVQQLWIAFGPRQQSFLVNFLLALPSTAVLAALAWHGLQRRLFAPQRSDPRFGEVASRPLIGFSRQRLARRLPAFASFAAIAIVLFVLAIGVMALTLLAFQPDGRGQ